MARRYPTSFAERNRIAIALVGIAALLGVFYVTFNADAMPVVGGGEEHTAYFAESGGLHEGDEVRVAGVKVGKVTSVELEDDRVLVSFRAKGVSLGSESTAAVEVKTMLGQKFLAVSPRGTEALDGPIPLEQTTTPYDVNAAFSDLSATITEIDTEQMEQSLTTLADTFADTPAAVRGTVSGLTRLSRTIATRDEELAELLTATTDVTGTLADRSEEIGTLIEDGDDLLTELVARREAVHQLLTNTATLGTELEGLVTDNEEQLQPALDKLDAVSVVLRDNQDNLDQAMKVLGPYYRMLATAMGNGRWVDSYICGLFDEENAPVLDSDVVRDCNPGGAR